MENVLIDTDVILDFFFDRKPFSDAAAVILSLCESKNINGFITPVICSNLYYLLRRNSRHEKVIEKLSQLVSIIDILQMDKEVVIASLSSKFKDFEDALQHYSAVRSGKVDVIVTRNVKDFAKSNIGVLTPNSFLKAFHSSH